MREKGREGGTDPSNGGHRASQKTGCREGAAGVHFSRPLPASGTDPFSPPQGCPSSPGGSGEEPEPEEAGGRMLRCLATPHTHAPVSLVTQQGGGRCLPSWERVRESVERAGRCWTGRCCHEACLPPTQGLRTWLPPPGALSSHRARPVLTHFVLWAATE